MIARFWSATTSAAQAPAYAEHLRAHVIPALRSLEGYVGADLLQREAAGGAVEILVITRWQSLDAIRAFAGDDLEHAVVADEAAAVLTTFERRARHYEVVVSDAE